MCLANYGAREAIYLCNVVEKIHQYFRPKNAPMFLENKISRSLPLLVHVILSKISEKIMFITCTSYLLGTNLTTYFCKGPQKRPSVFGYGSGKNNYVSRGRIPGRNPDRILRVFLLAIHMHLYSVAWDFCSFKLTQPLTVSKVQKFRYCTL